MITTWVLLIGLVGVQPVYFADKTACETAALFYRQRFYAAQCFPNAYPVWRETK